MASDGRAFRRLRRQLVAALEDHLAGAPLRVPEAGLLVWSWFAGLTATRTRHAAAGPHPISFTEIAAFAQLYSWPIEASHVTLIRALDDAWMGWHQHRPAMAAAQDMTPDAFDAVFGR